MKNHFKFFLYISIILSLLSSCTNTKEIELDIDMTKKQIELIDHEILQLKIKKNKYIASNSALLHRIVLTKIDPEIYQYESSRELLLIKLESLYQKL